MAAANTGAATPKNLRDDPQLPERGVKRVSVFLDWCRRNHVAGFLGEFGIPGEQRGLARGAGRRRLKFSRRPTHWPVIGRPANGGTIIRSRFSHETTCGSRPLNWTFYALACVAESSILIRRRRMPFIGRHADMTGPKQPVNSSAAWR